MGAISTPKNVLNEKVYFRHRIYYVFRQGQVAVETIRAIYPRCGNSAITERGTRERFTKFENSIRYLKDASRSGRPSGFDDDDHLKVLLKESV